MYVEYWNVSIDNGRMVCQSIDNWTVNSINAGLHQQWDHRQSTQCKSSAQGTHQGGLNMQNNWLAHIKYAYDTKTVSAKTQTIGNYWFWLTRYMMIDLTWRLITAKHLQPTSSDNDFTDISLTPHFPSHTKKDEHSFILKWLQFPIKLAYAITFNWDQGSLQKVGIILPVFGHMVNDVLPTSGLTATNKALKIIIYPKSDITYKHCLHT